MRCLRPLRRIGRVVFLGAWLTNPRVITLGQGQYGDRQGLVVLTTERLFFFEKSLGGETIDEFSLSAITSLSAGKSRLGGEHLVVHAAGNSTEIKKLFHGHADEIAREFRRIRSDAGAGAAGGPPAISPSSDDLVATLKNLAELREQGVLTAEEFEHKKAEILARL